jgi:hypothetical protein
MLIRFSAFQIDNPDEIPFSPEEYSRFKFGDGKVAEKFGFQLAHRFIQYHGNFLRKGKPMVVISSPYAHIPTASFHLKRHFVNGINDWLISNNLPVVQESKMHRSVTYRVDYGNLDAEERSRLIENDKLHLDRTFLGERTLLFMDDIRITGSHEKLISRYLESNAYANEIFLIYFAELTNKEISPKIENFLNYYFVKGIGEVLSIMKDPGFCVNTRIVKFLLSSNPSDFSIFLDNAEMAIRQEVFFSAIGNEYHEIEEYRTNLYRLRSSFL